MRIVHVTDAFLPKRGGIEIQVAELARRQRDAGHDVSIVTRAPGGPTEAPGGVPVHRAAPSMAPWQWVPTGRRVVELVEGSGADAVHCHLSVVSPAAVVALRAAARTGLPAVATYHSVLPTQPHSWLPLRRLPFDATRIEWTAVSEVAAASVSRLLGAGVEVHVLPNGLDLSAWRPPAQRTTRDNGELVLIWVGRVTGRKRPFAALRVLAEAQRRIDAAGGTTRLRLDVVGDGPWAAAARWQARRLGVEHQVRWLGVVDHAGVAAALAGADVFLATATAESFGIAAMEARSCGLPVLARTGTGLGELIEDGVSGLLAADDQAMADAVVRLTDDRLLAAMTHHNSTVAAPAGWAECLHQSELAYKRAAGVTR